MAAAMKSSRYGHRDATMILIGYGLRASELCDLQWSKVELASGRLHVRRAKNGSPSVHPRASEGDDVVREFGDNNPAGTSSRKRSKDQQG
jgi:integrase